MKGNSPVKRKFLALFALNITFLALLTIPTVVSYEQNAVTGPVRYSSENWSLTWGAINQNDETTALVEDPITADVFWGIKTYTATGSHLGVICRVNPEGTIEWTQECSGFFNLNFSFPVAMASSEDREILYVALSFSNGSGTKLAMVEYGVDTGILKTFMVIADSFTDHAVMDWDAHGNLIIAYEIDDSGSKVNVTAYDPKTHTMQTPLQIATSAYWNTPVALNGTGLNNKVALAISKANNGKTIYSGQLLVLDTAESMAVFAEETLDLGGSTDLEFIDMVADSTTYYVLMKKASVFSVASISTDLTTNYYTDWTLSFTNFYSMLLDSTGRIYLVGGSTNTFALELPSARQGIMVSIVKNRANTGFVSEGVQKYGDPAYEDQFFGMLEGQKGGLYVYGWGKSNGPEPYGDYDAYLINLNAAKEEEDSSSPPPSVFSTDQLMWLLISGFVIVSVVIAIVGSRKRGKGKLGNK